MIPSMIYLPPPTEEEGREGSATSGSNGTLLAVGENTLAGPYQLVLRWSEDLGATWSTQITPVNMPKPYTMANDLEQPQLGYDAKTGKVFLFFTIVVPTPKGGGCDMGELNEKGFWLVTSVDRGQHWGAAVDVQKTLPNKKNVNSSVCLAPNAGAGIQLHSGRLVFSGQTDSYNGSVAVFSDDGGKSWDWTGTLHQPGMDECTIAETQNGSLFAIMRSCPADLHGNCEGLQAEASSSQHAGAGNTRFSYAVSNDRGSNFGPIRLHPDLVTPVCMSSLFNHKSGALLFAGPYSETSRINMTVLAS
jgi:hypothetical protein